MTELSIPPLSSTPTPALDTSRRRTARSSTALTAPDALRAAGVHRARVWMGAIPHATIEAVVAEGACFRSAGGLQIEHPLLAPYRGRIEGTEDSIRGRPLALMERLIRAVTRG